MVPFLQKFVFRPELQGHVGVEREYFLLDGAGRPVPCSHQFLSVAHDPAWTYELSACQVEHRTSPRKTDAEIRRELADGRRHGEEIAQSIGCRLAALEVAPADMPLDVYAHDPRYAGIVECLALATLRAACRVTGTHIHVGMSSLDEALEASNALRPYIENLIRQGDHSGGERIRLYCEMATSSMPPHYLGRSHFEAVAREQGFHENPRNCWHLVRVSRHGTVEVRLFGVTDDDDEVLRWISAVRDIISSI
jgi:gamma-glutamyl:cysteine ligase YbdK (ATP-grasp superfamily)